MPPKKDDANAAAVDAITGFTAKETKMLAAAFVTSSGLDKYDYDLFATLTGNTAGSLKKMWPPVKRKAIEAHPSFGAFLGAEGAGQPKAKVATKAKVNDGGKRKAASTEPDEEGTKGLDTEAANGEETGKKKPAAKRGRKKIKSEENVEMEDDEAKKEAADHAAQEEI